jgi:hypothetical protein
LLTIAPAHMGNSGTTWKNAAAFLLLLTMKNASEKVLQVILADPASDYRVTAMHKTERVRVTENLPGVNEESKGATAPTRNIVKTLKSNETCQDAIEIKFWADRMGAGEYTLQVERDLPPELGKGLAESNTITVTVINQEECINVSNWQRKFASLRRKRVNKRYRDVSPITAMRAPYSIVAQSVSPAPIGHRRTNAIHYVSNQTMPLTVLRLELAGPSGGTTRHTPCSSGPHF